VKVLNVFLADAQRGWYGLELMRESCMQSGTLYPILARLERAGWVTSAKEDIDPHVEGRPARRYYRLTPDGVVQARQARAEVYAQLHRAGPIMPGALLPEGGAA
jgi:DNA-binding PadR family transcriptional regulator